MENLLSNLNDNQIKAVTHKRGPILVIAGAGTGKTTVITRRAAWLIKEKLAKPSEILALTFTDKAATEMDERILELLPYGVLDFTATTFHSFCQDVLKDYGIVTGISPDFKLLTQSQQILFIKQHLDEFSLNLYKPISNPNKFLAALVKLFSRAKNENISVDDYQKIARSATSEVKEALTSKVADREKALMITEQSQAYTVYERLKDKYGYFDFGDLIVKTLRLIQKRPTVLAKLQNKYKYIFVDEFQDTNYTQAQIIYLLAKKHNNLMVVGDDDQSIYKFRGASISNIMEFLDYYKKAKTITLTKNYRSTKEILNTSHKSIKNNNPNRLEIKAKINKKLRSNKSGNRTEFWHFNNNISEIDQIVKYIKNSNMPKAKSFSDFAILLRANSYADDFIEAFKKQGIPYQFVGNRGLYNREEIKELISYLKLLFNPDDNLALFHIALANQFKINKVLLRRLTNLSKRKNISLFEIFENIDKYTSEYLTSEVKKTSTPKHTSEVKEVQTSEVCFDSKIKIETISKSRKSISKIINLIKKHLDIARSWNTSKILIDYIHKSGMYGYLKSTSEVKSPKTSEVDFNIYESLEKIENIRLFFQKISEFENISEDKTVFSFIEYLNLIIESGDNPPIYQADKYEDAVNIMTVHSAKGLEFDTVFLPYLVHGRFPSRGMKDQIELPAEFIKEILPSGNIHIQEERRLFYVAMTRAKNELILSASDMYQNNKKKKKISQFVIEIIDQIHERDFHKIQNLDFLKHNNNQNKTKTVGTKQKQINLSPSALETFDKCPKCFEYNYIFKIKTETNQSLSFGDSIHNTLRDCYILLKNNNSLTHQLISHIYNKNWKDEGYLTKKEMNRAYQLGLQTIKKIIETDKIIPEAIEKKFKIDINDSCQLNGRIDKIVQNENGLEIIDYKTGDGRKKTKSEITKNLPLWIYALAENSIRFTSEVKSVETSEVLNGSNKKIKLTLHYVLNNKKISSEATEKKLTEKKEKIIEICNQISSAITKNDFPAKPTRFHCNYCSYKSICPHKHKGA